MGTSKRYPEEVRERAVRMVKKQQAEHGSQWAAISSIAGKIGCTAESLRAGIYPLSWGLCRQDRRRQNRRHEVEKPDASGCTMTAQL